MEGQILKTLFLIFLVLGSFLIDNGNSIPVTIVVLHTADVHSRFDMVDILGRDCSDPQRCFGGVARRFTYIKEVKQSNRNVLLFDSGDQLPGSTWFFHHKGKVEKHFLSKLGYTAIALGHNEFGLGGNKLSTYLTNFTIPIVCANLVRNRRVPAVILDKITASFIKDVSGVKVGITGYIDPRVQTRYDTRPMTFDDPKERVLTEIRNLKANGSKINIVLSHAGYDADVDLFGEEQDIHIILGGYSHTLHKNQIPPNPKDVGYDISRKPAILHPGPYGSHIGHLNLSYFNNVVTPEEGDSIQLDQTFAEDSTVVAELNSFYKPSMQFYEMGVGKSDALITWDQDCFKGICEPGQILATAMLNYSRMKDSWTADLSLVHAAVFDDNVFEGEVSYSDVVRLLPFETKIVKASYLGQQIKEAFEHMVEGLQNNTGNCLNFAGMHVTYDDSTYEIVEIKVITHNLTEKKYIDFDNEMMYNVILPEGLTRGILGYRALENTQITDIEVIDLDVMLAYLDMYHTFKVIPSRPLSRTKVTSRLTLPEQTLRWASFFISFLLLIISLGTLLYVIRSQGKRPKKE